MARSKKVYLVFRASDESFRVVTRPPSVAWDEVYWTLEVKIPDPWGRLAGAIVIDLPDAGPPVVEVTNREVPAQEGDGR